jgi:hypothetical protein
MWWILILIAGVVFFCLASLGASLTVILCVGFFVLTAVIVLVGNVVVLPSESDELQRAVEDVAEAVERLHATIKQLLEKKEESEPPDKAPLKSRRTR